MTTYAIAYTDTAIWGTVPMAPNFMEALKDEVREWEDRDNPLWGTDELRVGTGLRLTNDPGDDEEVVFTSGRGRCGWITDNNGETYEYAVRAA